MSTTYQQTDTSATFNVACSGRSAGTTTAARAASVGGTAGVTEVTVDPGDTNPTRAVFAFELTPPMLSSWDAGTWTVNVNVSTQDAHTTLEEVHICDNNGGTFADVDSGGGGTQATALGLTGSGVKNINVTQNNAHTPQNTMNSRAFVVLVETSDAGNHGPSSSGITPSETIVTPYTLAASGRGTYNSDTVALGTRTGMSLRLRNKRGSGTQGLLRFLMKKGIWVPGTRLYVPSFWYPGERAA